MIIQADSVHIPLVDKSIMCCITSPPYYSLRSYLPVDHPDKRKELGLESTTEEYIANLVAVGRELWRVLRDDGTFWLNLGDSYCHNESSSRSNRTDKTNHKVGGWGIKAKTVSHIIPSGLKPKDLMMIPARVALALQEDGWYLRAEIVWAKPNPMPESVQGSHYSRHRVTIEEYENLSRMRKTRSEIKDRASNLSNVSASEIFEGEEEISTQSERSGNSKGQRAKAGRKGKTSSIQQIETGSIEQGEIRGNGKGKENTPKSRNEVSGKRTLQTEVSRDLSKNKGFTFSDSSKEESQQTLSGNIEVEGQEASGLRAQEVGNSSISASDSGRLVRDSGSSQEPMSLLREGETSNNRSCNTIEQRGIAREGEHRTSLSELQFEEEGSPDKTGLIDCPGCPKCEEHGGYIFHLSAGRPTRSHEMIYLFTKSRTYYYDAEAVKEKSIDSESYTGIRPRNAGTMNNVDPDNYKFHGSINENGKRKSGQTYPTRNQRDVWILATEPYSGAHYATFPTEIPRRAILAGTSTNGHCAKCGKGWVRVVEKEIINYSPSPRSNGNTDRNDSRDARTERKSKTLGWQPTCKCNADITPAIVLDPFCGSGTVGEVCRELGRRFIGLDLSMKYLRENAMPRAKRSQTPESIARLPLFGGNGDEQLLLKQDATGNPTYTGFNARWKESNG